MFMSDDWEPTPEASYEAMRLAQLYLKTLLNRPPFPLDIATLAVTLDAFRRVGIERMQSEAAQLCEEESRLQYNRRSTNVSAHYRAMACAIREIKL